MAGSYLPIRFEIRDVARLRSGPGRSKDIYGCAIFLEPPAVGEIFESSLGEGGEILSLPFPLRFHPSVLRWVALIPGATYITETGSLLSRSFMFLDVGNTNLRNLPPQDSQGPQGVCYYLEYLRVCVEVCFGGILYLFFLSFCVSKSLQLRCSKTEICSIFEF